MYRELLTTARNLVDGWGGELVFVYLPEWGRISGSDAAMPHRDAMLELVRGLDVDIMDATPVLMGHEDPLSLFPLGLSGHYNEAGYALVADGIADFIGER